MFTFVFSDVWAVVESVGSDVVTVSSNNISDESVPFDSFTIPEHLGQIRYSHKGRSDKFIVHIQDAHCNYHAQKVTAELIGYLHETYGIDVINLEGGVGEYDLSVFDVLETEPRKSVATHFMKTGELNGAEFYALNSGLYDDLWGVENKSLYLENLSVYRSSLDYRDKVLPGLDALGHAMNVLKRDNMSEELLVLDVGYNAYKSGNMEFREYMELLLETAAKNEVDTDKYKNITLLAQAMSLEKGLDFKTAQSQRNNVIDVLEDTLSINERKELIAQVLAFREKRLSREGLYGFILKKAEGLHIQPEELSALRHYLAYIEIYGAVDRYAVGYEIDEMDEEIRGALFRSDKEELISDLSKNLAILRNIFEVSLTKSDHEKYIANPEAFAMSGYLSLIEDPSGRISEKVEDIDARREEMARFYELSFARDKAFMDNMKFTRVSGARAAVLMTGGFHTENLCELMKERDISYVSILPCFTMPEGFKSPYFDILSGHPDVMQVMLSEVIAANSTLQIASLLNPALAEAARGVDAVDAFKAAVVIRGMVEAGKKVIVLDDEGIPAVVPDGLVCEFGEDSTGTVEVSIKQLLFLADGGVEGQDVPIDLSDLLGPRIRDHFGLGNGSGRVIELGLTVPDMDTIGEQGETVRQAIPEEGEASRGSYAITAAHVMKQESGSPIRYTMVVDSAAELRENAITSLVRPGIGRFDLVLRFYVYPEQQIVYLDSLSIGKGPDDKDGLRGRGYVSELFAKFAGTLEKEYPGWDIVTIALEMKYKEGFQVIPYLMKRYFNAENRLHEGYRDVMGILDPMDLVSMHSGTIGDRFASDQEMAVIREQYSRYDDSMANMGLVGYMDNVAAKALSLIREKGPAGLEEWYAEQQAAFERGDTMPVFVDEMYSLGKALTEVEKTPRQDRDSGFFGKAKGFLGVLLVTALALLNLTLASCNAVNDALADKDMTEQVESNDVFAEYNARINDAIEKLKGDFQLIKDKLSDEELRLARGVVEVLSDTKVEFIADKNYAHADIEKGHIGLPESSFATDDIMRSGLIHEALHHVYARWGLDLDETPKVSGFKTGADYWQWLSPGEEGWVLRNTSLLEKAFLVNMPGIKLEFIYGETPEPGSDVMVYDSEPVTIDRMGELMRDESLIKEKREFLLRMTAIFALNKGPEVGHMKIAEQDSSKAFEMLKAQQEHYSRRARDILLELRTLAGDRSLTLDRIYNEVGRDGNSMLSRAFNNYHNDSRAYGQIDKLVVALWSENELHKVVLQALEMYENVRKEEREKSSKDVSKDSGSWFKAKTWVATAWITETLISLGVGALLAYFGFESLAPFAAALTFWMPHLFFDNKVAARSLPVISLTAATYGAMFLAAGNGLGLLAVPALMFMHWAINRTALEAMPDIVEARAYSIEEKDAVLAAGKYRKPTHQKVHDSIEEGLPDDLKGFADKNPEEQEQLKNKYRDPDGQIVIPIDQLAWNTGLLGHIGLGQYYGEPVIYIHHGLNRTGMEKERAKVKAHELYEIRKWEEKRKEIGLDNKGMREWIRANSNARGNGPAQLLAKKWHSEAPEVDSVYRHENIIRAFQNGRLERAYERIRAAIIANMDEWRAVSGEVVGEPLEFIDKYFMEVLTRNSFVAGILPEGKVRFIAAFAEALNDDELAWVLAHEMVHGQKMFQLEREQDVLMGRAAAYSGIQAEFAKWAGIKAPESVSLSDAIESAKHALPDVVEGIEEKSQEEEFQADELGVFLIARAGFDPRAGVSAAEKLRMLLDDMHDRGLVEADPTIPRLDDHPDDHLRAEANRKSAEKYTSESTEAIYAEEADVVLAAGTATLPGAGMRQFREYIDSFDVKNLREILYSEGKHIAKQYGFAPGFIPIYDELRALVRARFDMSNLTPKDVIRIARGLMTDEEDDYRLVGHGDTHGELEGFLENLRNAGLIDENGDWIGGNAVLVQMGDLIDRGPKSRECVDFLIKLQQQARDAGGDVVILLGNHELFLLQDIPREFIQTLVRQEGLTPEAAKTEAEKMKKKIEKYIANGNIVASHYAKGRVFVHGGFRSKIREGIKDEVALARGVSRDEVTSGQMVERMNAILRDTAAEKDVPDFVKYEHPIFGVDKARKGTAEVAGIFWADYRDLQKSTMAGEVPQIVAHSPEKRPGAGIRAGMSVRRIDIDAGLFEGYGGNRAYLVMEKGAIKAVEKVGDEYKERVLGSYGVVSATGEEPEAEGPYFDMDMQKTQMFDASKYITMAAARRYTPRPNIVALKSGPEFDKHLEETARYLLDKFPEYLRDYSQLQDDRVANEVMQNIVLDMEITDRTFIKRVLIRAIEIAGRRSPLSAGSWFASKAWVKNAWWAETLTAVGSGAAVLAFGVDWLAPIVATAVFWMPHLFFDNKGSATRTNTLRLTAGMLLATTLALATPIGGVLALGVLAYYHRHLNARVVTNMEIREQSLFVPAWPSADYYKYLGEFQAFSRLQLDQVEGLDPAEEKMRKDQLANIYYFKGTEPDWMNIMPEVTRLAASGDTNTYVGVSSAYQVFSHLSAGFQNGIIVDFNPYVIEVLVPIMFSFASVSRNRADYLAKLAGVYLSPKEISGLENASLSDIMRVVSARLDESDDDPRYKRQHELIRNYQWASVRNVFPDHILAQAKWFFDDVFDENIRKNMSIASSDSNLILLDGREGTEYGWLHSEENFARVRDMMVSGRLKGITGDWSDKKMFFDLSSRMRWDGQIAGMIYTSNLHEWLYRDTDPQKVVDMMANVLVLPRGREAVYVTQHQVFAHNVRGTVMRPIRELADADINTALNETFPDSFDADGKPFMRLNNFGRTAFGAAWEKSTLIAADLTQEDKEALFKESWQVSTNNTFFTEKGAVKIEDEIEVRVVPRNMMDWIGGKIDIVRIGKAILVSDEMARELNIPVKRSLSEGDEMKSLLANMFSGRLSWINWPVRAMAFASTPFHEMGHILAAKIAGVKYEWSAPGLFTGKVFTEKRTGFVAWGGVLANIMAGSIALGVAVFLVPATGYHVLLSSLGILSIFNLGSALLELSASLLGVGDLAGKEEFRDHDVGRMVRIIEQGTGPELYGFTSRYNKLSPFAQRRFLSSLSDEGRRRWDIIQFTGADETPGMRTGGSLTREEKDARARMFELARNWNIMASGITENKGGLSALLKVILLGKILVSEDYWSRLSDTFRPEESAGLHGPYWVAFDEDVADDWKEGVNHSYYIVRNAEEKNFLIEAIDRAEDEGLVEREYADAARAKVMSYEDMNTELGSWAGMTMEELNAIDENSKVAVLRVDDFEEFGAPEEDPLGAWKAKKKELKDVQQRVASYIESHADKARALWNTGANNRTAVILIDGDDDAAAEFVEELRVAMAPEGYTVSAGYIGIGDFKREFARDHNAGQLGYDDMYGLFNLLKWIAEEEGTGHTTEMAEAMERRSRKKTIDTIKYQLEWKGRVESARRGVDELTPEEMAGEDVEALIPVFWPEGFFSDRNVRTFVEKAYDRHEKGEEPEVVVASAKVVDPGAFSLDMLNRGYRANVNGKDSHIRGIAPQQRMVRNYIRALETRDETDGMVVPPVRKVYLPMITMKGGRVPEPVRKGESQLPAETVNMLRDAHARGVIELVEINNTKELAQAAGELNVLYGDLTDILFSSSMIFVSDWVGTDAQDHLREYSDDEEAMKDMGHALARTLKALHEEGLICGDTHLSQFVVAPGGNETLRVDLRNIYSFDDMAPENIFDNIDAEYSWVRGSLESFSDVAARAFDEVYPRDMKYKLAGKKLPGKGKEEEEASIDRVDVAKAALADLRTGVMDWIVTPAGEFDMGGKETIDRAVSRKLRKDYGSRTRVFNYEYGPSMSDNDIAVSLGGMFIELLSDMSKEKYARMFPRASVFVPRDNMDVARDVLAVKAGELELEGMAERINIIATGDVPNDMTIDEVMHVVVGKSLLNYERFRKGDYSDAMPDAALDRLARLLEMLSSGMETASLDEARELLDRVLDGMAVLRMVPVDYEEIADWKKAQQEVLKSL